MEFKISCSRCSQRRKVTLRPQPLNVVIIHIMNSNNMYLMLIRHSLKFSI